MGLEALIALIDDGVPPANWEQANEGALAELFGAPSGRYGADAGKSIDLRAPAMKNDSDAPFSAYIHPANPKTGPYGGMSIAIFPVPDKPALLTFVVGTAGLHPDEEILGRPGHARKVRAICDWLNRKHGAGNVIAWSKQDPVRVDQPAPSEVVRQFGDYSGAFSKYGNVLYAIFAPNGDRAATADAVAAFLDLMFAERGFSVLASSASHADDIRAQWFAHLMPDVTKDDVATLLTSRRFVVIQGPPGTGKTRMAEQLLAQDYAGNGFSVQFHANTTYENFVGGLAPIVSGGDVGLQFAPVKGHLMRAIEDARKNPSTRFLLHIDEINRADLGKVLGEAIFLLEPGEPDREVDLPYQFDAPIGAKLSIPPNLDIIGTMNSSDRSLAIVDVAVRRRFAFVKLWPQMRVVEEYGGERMQKAYIALTSIFIDHATEESFDLIPGHSYFLELDDEQATRRLRVTLVPLLDEYLAQGYVAGFAESIRSYLQWIDSL